MTPTVKCDGDCLEVRINGDTRFDIEFVRQYVKDEGLVVLPPGVVTVTSTTPVPGGVVTLSMVGEKPWRKASAGGSATSSVPVRSMQQAALQVNLFHRAVSAAGAKPRVLAYSSDCAKYAICPM